MNVLLLYSCSDSLTRRADSCPNIVAWTSCVLSPIASLRIRPPQDVDVPADLDFQRASKIQDAECKIT